jgi:hypothetical protein
VARRTVGSEWIDLFVEYEAAATLEARFWEEPEFGVIDSKIDGRCAHDAFLRRRNVAVKAGAETKVTGGSSVDPEDS